MAAMALSCCGCSSGNYSPIGGGESGSETGGGEEKPAAVRTYDISSPTATFKTEVKELSSLCFTSSEDGFYAVGDEGDVFELGLDGKTVSKLYSKVNHDWEGVDCNGNVIYLMEETESALYKLQGGKLTKVADIDVPGGGVSGKGPEGLMCAKDLAYIGNQMSPTRIVKYSLTKSESLGWFDISFVSKYISDLCFDPVDNTMWIVDSKGPAFYHCTLDGKLIATYNIPFVEQAEALAVDHNGGIAWVGCDKTSNIYKIKIEI
ncbi:MAG: SdiA-regulated domain-containing protein [Bacteroidales bacterium]|nr:SdiA-regulated domain-containing protein [Bacteroidales bacterium]